MSGRRARRLRADLRAERVTLGLARFASARPTPVGLVSQFLTLGDLTPAPSELLHVPAALMGIPAEATLSWIATMLAPSAFGGTWRAHQKQQAKLWFNPFTARGRRALELLDSGERVLLAPQVLLLMARLACIYGTAEPGVTLDADAENRLRTTMLLLAHHVGATRREQDAAAPAQPEDAPGPEAPSTLEVEMVANQLLNRMPFPMSVFDRFERRWREIPHENRNSVQMVDLSAEYKAATGAALADLADVALTLWSRSVGGSSPVAMPDYLAQLKREPDDIERVLGLIADTPQGIAARSLAAAHPTTAAGREALNPEYDTALFGQTPIIRLSGGRLLVLSPVLLLERAFGWLPAYDIKAGFAPAGRGGERRTQRAEAALRRSTEIFAVETLFAVAHASQDPAATYGEEQVQAAYGTASPNADAACAWPGHWVVAEVSSRQTPRSVAGASSAKALLEHLDRGAVEKVRQLDGTITAIRANEGLLTGRPDEERRQFWPLLIVPDGFPLTTVTMQRLRRMIRNAGLLVEEDTADLVIADAEALEAAETVAVQSGQSLPALLMEHAASSYSLYSLRDWLVLTRGTLRPSGRVSKRWSRNLNLLHEVGGLDDELSLPLKPPTGHPAKLR